MKLLSIFSLFVLFSCSNDLKTMISNNASFNNKKVEFVDNDTFISQCSSDKKTVLVSNQAVNKGTKSYRENRIIRKVIENEIKHCN